MMLLSVIIEYFSINEINTYYGNLHEIIVQYLKSDVPSLKRLAIETVNNLTQNGQAIRVLKKYPELIPLVLNAVELSQEELIQKIFETMTDFLESKKVMTPHLSMLIEAAVGISLNTNMMFNVREVTIHFLELLGDSFGKYLAKKNMMPQLERVINCGFQLASESTEEYADEEASPSSQALYMIYNFASEVPNATAWPLFKRNILQSMQQESPLVRAGALKILGHVCDSDALLDCVKEDIEELTALLVKALNDPCMNVREAATQAVGQFSENVVPEFLELHAQVMPCLLQMVASQVEIATTTNEHGLTAEKALFGMAEFASQMDDVDIKPYMATGLEIIAKYMNGPGQKRGVRYQALNCLSAFILAGDHLILPYMTGLLDNLYSIVTQTTDRDSQQVKGQALMCAGNLA
jgi:importin-4